MVERQLPKLNTAVRFRSLAPMLFLFILTGCATTGGSTIYMPMPKIERPNMPGFYHKVEKGQTLWRVAKFYNVNIDDVVKVNRIPDATQISVGQLLFIPSTASKKPDEPQRYSSDFTKSDFIWPVRGKIISFYGSKKDGVLNKGIDISVREGVDVVASRSGKVVFCDSKMKGLGQTIMIDHLDGFSTLYAQNSSVLARTGQYVKQGQLIAKAGSTGRADRACLHFQIRKGEKPQNPFYYLPR